MICVLIGSPWILTFLVPRVPPAPHLLDLPLLGAHDVPCEFPYLWDIAVLVGHFRHLYGRLVVRNHGVDERLVEGSLLSQPLRVHHHAHASYLLRAHLYRYLRGTELFLLYGLQLLYLGLLAGDNVRGELLYLLVLGVLEGHFGHSDCFLVVGYHRVDKALVGVLAVLHDHLLGHALGTHAYRAVAHLAMVHP